MTNAPTDLLGFRAVVRAATMLAANAVGIVGDGAHQRTGGYHEGKDVLAAIGRFHAPPSAHVGASTEDYSARQSRDRLGLTNDASATDIGDNWPTGGRAAWLRFNNLLYAEMRDRPANLPALRAINVSLDGSRKQRYDQMHRGDGLIASTDTVTTHTHLEFWRDTAGKRQPTLDRIVQLVRAAITGSTKPGDDMLKDEIVLTREQSPDGIARNGALVLGELYVLLRWLRTFGDTEPARVGKLAELLTAAAAPAAAVTVAFDEVQLDALAAKVAPKVAALIPRGATPEEVRQGVAEILAGTALTPHG